MDISQVGGDVDIEPFTDLFAEDYTVKSWADCSNYIGWRLLPLPEDGVQSLDFLYHKTPETAIDAYKTIAAKMKPSQKVREIIKSVDFSPNLTGLLFRSRSDHLPPKRRQHWARWLRVISRSKPCFLATDCAPLKEALRNEDGVKVVNRDMSRMYVADWTYALAEMILLGRCNTMVLNDRFSTFAEAGWWLGGCKAKVIFENKEDVLLI